MDLTPVSPAQITTFDGLDGWHVVGTTIVTELRTGSFTRGAVLVAAIAGAADAAGHHPDVELRYPDRVRAVLTTHATGGLTVADVELARTISALAGALGATLEP